MKSSFHKPITSLKLSFLLVSFLFCSLFSYLVGCAPVKSKDISRSSSNEDANKKPIPSGKFPQLSAPSLAMRTACGRMNAAFDCATLPWNLEDYNKVAAQADAAQELCSHQVYVAADSPTSLLNQGNSNGTAVTTVFQNAKLEVAQSDVPGKVAFVQVRYVDGQLKSYGNTANSEAAVFVDRKKVTCQIPDAASSAGLDDSASERGVPSTSGIPTAATGASSPVQASKPETGAGQTLSGASAPSVVAPQIAQPRPVPRMKCKADVPFHAKIWPWATPICTKVDGTAIELKRQDDITVKTSPEAGSPVSYYETERKCFIKEENVEMNTCKPL